MVEPCAGRAAVVDPAVSAIGAIGVVRAVGRVVRSVVEPGVGRITVVDAAVCVILVVRVTRAVGRVIRGVVEPILRDAGFTLTAVPDAHLCCGSAGTYSILQPELSQQLLRNKVAALESGAPEAIATANIGCLTHIASGSARPVRHWIEILDARLGQP